MPNRNFLLASLGVSVLFGITALLPHIFQKFDSTYPYKGVEFMAADAEVHYGARVREVYDGHTLVSNTYLKEPKNLPYLIPPYPERLVATSARLLHVDPIQFFIWSKGLFAIVLTLLFIGVAASLSGRKWESLLAVSAVLFANSLLNAPWDIFRLLSGDHLFEVLRFSRPFNPLWTFSWFCGALWLLSLWVRKRSLLIILGSALCTTVLLYSYVYAWTFLGVAMALMFVRYLWLKDWVRVRDFLLFFFVFSVLGSPYFINLWNTAQSPLYEAASKRLGVVVLHRPIIGAWAIVFLVFSLASRKIWKDQWWLIVSLAISSIVSLNQQVITGMHLVPHHYHWYFVQPLASLTTIIVVLVLLQRIRVSASVKTAAAFGMMALSIGVGVLVQVRAYEAVRAEWGSYQRFVPVINALKALPADAAIYSQERTLLDLLPIYTPLNVYDSTNASNYLVGPAQVRDVFWFELWIQGVTAEEAAKRFLLDLRATLSSRIYAIYYREALGSYDRIPDDVVATHAQEYREYLGRSTKEKLCRWPLDFVVFAVTDKASPAWTEIRQNTDEKITGSGFTIGKVKEGLCQ